MNAPPPCSRWVYYDNPVPPWATAEAVRILAAWNAGAVNPQTGKPFALGDDVYETGGDGRHVRYMLRRHPPDPQNPVEHNGVEVQYCADDVQPQPSPAPGPAPAPSPWEVEGIDVSDAQGIIDWTAVRDGGGKSFAFIKATEGLPGAFHTPQQTFAHNWSNAAGLVRGAYHYFRPSQDPVAQAKHFASVVGPLGPSDLGPVLDCEHADDVEPTSDYAPAFYGPRVLAYVTAVATLTGKRPIVYASRDTFSLLVGAREALAIAARADLWMAVWPPMGAPPAAPGTQPPGTAAPWRGPMFWQYYSGEQGGTCEGVPTRVDLDRWRGTANDLLRYAAGQLPTPPPLPGGGGVSAGPSRSSS